MIKGLVVAGGLMCLSIWISNGSGIPFVIGAVMGMSGYHLIRESE